MTSERNVLASSIYNALSSQCSNMDSQSLITTLQPTTTWDYDASTMGHTSVSKTLTACATEAATVSSVYWLESESEHQPDKGDLTISVTDSFFTEGNLDAWMWTTAFAYAYVAINHTNLMEYEYHDAYTGEVKPHVLAQHYGASGFELSYKANLPGEPDRESMKTTMAFHESKEDEIACEIMAALIDTFASFASTALPELAPEIEEASIEGSEQFMASCEDSAS